MDSLRIVQKFYPDVSAVKDATKAVRIEVTKADVRTSAVKSHKGCAMAVACKRKMHLDGVVISRSIAYLVKENLATRYEVPAALAREVVAFDRGGSFETGEYQLKKPHAYIAMGTSRKTGKRDGSKPAQSPRHVTANIRTSLGGVK